MIVKIAQLSTGSSPRVAATVDTARVTYRIRDGRPASRGWMCSVHPGDQDCDHIDELLDLIDNTVIERYALDSGFIN